jgi:single-stranded-DNA-specific exonuclease
LTESLNRFFWEEREPASPDIIDRLVAHHHIPAAAARFLAARDLTSEDSSTAYLNAASVPAHDPFLFENMNEAVDKVRRAIVEKRSIMIHGDYDVDGISGTAILYEFLNGTTPEIFRFVPDRRKDGYGVAVRAVDWAIERGIGLFIAVDCGTSDGDQIRRLEEAGTAVIVCDHHELPAAGGVRGTLLNPVRAGEPYPFHGLCGAGVAYKLICALEARGIAGGVPSSDVLDLVAVATVGDLAPLTDENRRFVREGLSRINSNGRLGLMALRRAAGLDAPAVTASHLGFTLAPRLNAAGRVANPKAALELLTEKDAKRTKRLAAKLEEQNEYRQRLTRQVTDEAVEQIMGMKGWRDAGAFVLAGKNWDEGVLGIAASRVVEDFGRPALLISLAGETGKGSGRSIPGVHLKQQLDRCAAHLLRFGGHAQAVGFSIAPDRVDPFAEEMTRAIGEVTAGMPRQPRLRVDSALSLQECSLELLDFLERCEPFGVGNRTPVWKVAALEVLPNTRLVGKGHLKLHVRDRSGMEGQAIRFNWGGEEPAGLYGRTVDLAVRVRKNHFNGQTYADLHVADLREVS